jgi:hypothetical protein
VCLATDGGRKDGRICAIGKATQLGVLLATGPARFEIGRETTSGGSCLQTGKARREGADKDLATGRCRDHHQFASLTPSLGN